MCELEKFQIKMTFKSHDCVMFIFVGVLYLLQLGLPPPPRQKSKKR